MLALLLVPAIMILAVLGLTEWQIWVVTLILVPILGEILKLLSVQFGYKPTKFVMMLFLSGAALGLASVFNLDLFRTLPSMGDGFLAWLEALVFVVGSLIGLAKIIYDMVWDKVFDRLAKGGYSLLAYRLPK